MDGLRTKLENILSNKNLAQLIYEGETWNLAYNLDYDTVTTAEREGLIKKSAGVFGVLWFIPSEELITKKTALGKTYIYPDLFEKFWQSYHPKRRIGKQEAFRQWKDIPVEDRMILPGMAEKYISHMLATSAVKFIVHPERFIKRKLYLDFREFESNDEDILRTIEFFTANYTKKLGHAYPFTDKDKDRLITDVEAFGKRRTCELIWMYFNDFIPAAREKAKENMYDYYTFSYLLKGALGQTKKSLPPKCEYCGQRIGHNSKCPTLHARKEAKRKEAEEVETARNMDIDLTGSMPWSRK